MQQQNQLPCEKKYILTHPKEKNGTFQQNIKMQKKPEHPDIQHLENAWIEIKQEHFKKIFLDHDIYQKSGD